jgi:competence CoiA-like predicted nuclease
MFSKRRRIWILKQDCYQNSFFQTRQKLIFSTCRILIIWISFRNRHFSSTKNEIRQTIKRCKLNNASKFDDIFNRIFKIFVNKLMSHLINLFQVCAALNYHSRCFRETHIIALKKLDKKNYINIETYKSIAFLNTFDKTFESIIARRIDDLTKVHDLFFVNQMKKRKNRSCKTVLKLFTKQIHIV